MPGGRTFIVWNASAGTADGAGRALALLRALPASRILESADPACIVPAVRQAVAEGADLVIAAGGDGTVNATLNGLAGDRTRVRFGIVPTGTGNDFARTLCLPEDPEQAARLVTSGHTQAIDLVEIEAAGRKHLYVNMASGGLSGHVIEEVETRDKKTWGPLAYVKAAVANLKDAQPYDMQIAIDGQATRHVRAYNMILANGRTTSHGRLIAPLANPQDGLLEAIFILDGSLLDLAALAARYAAGDHLESDQVLYLQAARVEVRSQPAFSIVADGDVLTHARATGERPIVFRVLRGAINAIVGPQYCPEPAHEA